jgi:hypothetical protein
MSEQHHGYRFQIMIARDDQRFLSDHVTQVRIRSSFQQGLDCCLAGGAPHDRDHQGCEAVPRSVPERIEIETSILQDRNDSGVSTPGSLMNKRLLAQSRLLKTIESKRSVC